MKRYMNTLSDISSIHNKFGSKFLGRVGGKLSFTSEINGASSKKTGFITYRFK